LYISIHKFFYFWSIDMETWKEFQFLTPWSQ
jgi:hypothetical protein